MIKKIFASLFILPATLLSSCNTVNLRSDIAKFIASFSLETSLATYQEAGYTKSRNETKSGVYTQEVETFDFNVKNPDLLSYRKEYTKWIDGQESEHLLEYVNYYEGSYLFYKNSDQPVTYSSAQVRSLILKFFYETTAFDETLHDGGMYRGDVMKHNAAGIQNMVTIDEEIGTFTYAVDLKGKTETGVEATVKETTVVDRIGMLLTFSSTIEAGEDSSIMSIGTYIK